MPNLILFREAEFLLRELKLLKQVGKVEVIEEVQGHGGARDHFSLFHLVPFLAVRGMALWAHNCFL
jgi:hypothetical protein